MGELSLSFLASAVVTAVPMLLVTVAGIVFCAVRGRTLQRSAGLAITGCAVLIFGTVGSVAWLFVFPRLLYYGGYSVASLGATSLTVSLVLALVHATGVGLLIGAVLSGARSPDGPVPSRS